jgi:hypothetical protein
VLEATFGDPSTVTVTVESLVLGSIEIIFTFTLEGIVVNLITFEFSSIDIFSYQLLLEFEAENSYFTSKAAFSVKTSSFSQLHSSQ